MKKKWIPLLLIIAGVVLIALHFIPFGGGDLSETIDQANYIMPSAYKVYANPDALNGEYYLFKMLVTNDSKKPVHNVKVSYRIPNYLDWTDLETIPVIYPGENVVVRCYPEFKDDITDKMTESEERTEIRIDYNGNKTDNQSFSFKMLGRNQFVYTDLPPDQIASWPDEFRNAKLLPCLVTPEDPIIKYYAQQIQDKILKGEEASVDQKPEDAVRFMEGIYAATYLSHMVYSGTEGIPQTLGDDQYLVQSIRLPREVVTGNTGLCIELSLLYASVMKEAGLHPVLFWIPGHVFPGVEVANQYYAIEATAIGGQGLGSSVSDPQQAFQIGMKELNDFFQHAEQGDSRYAIIDVDQLQNKGAAAMELKDDDFLRKKIDDIAATWTSNVNIGGVQDAQMAANNEGNNNDNGMTQYAGVVNFNYPAAWARHDHPYPQMPFLISYMASSDKANEIDVYNLQQTSSTDQALQYLGQQFSRLGARIQYKLVSQSNGYAVYDGQTSSSAGTMQWRGVFRDSNTGVAGVVVSSKQFDQMSDVINTILSSIK
jgi:hypothetical protein